MQGLQASTYDLGHPGVSNLSGLYTASEDPSTVPFSQRIPSITIVFVRGRHKVTCRKVRIVSGRRDHQ